MDSRSKVSLQRAVSSERPASLERPESLERVASFERPPRVSFHPNTVPSSTGSDSSDDEEVPSIFVDELSIRGLTFKEERLLSCLEFLDGLDDEEYVMCVDAIVCDRKHLHLENKVLKEYLKVYEPNMIADMSKVAEMIHELERRGPLMPSILAVPPEPDTPMAFMFSALGARLNVSVRTDLVMRYMEDLQSSLEKFTKRAESEKAKYNAAIEESSIWLAELEQEREEFDAAMEASIDPVTARIPAEKFINFMENNLKRARQTTERYRLRNNSLKSAYVRAKASLDQKRELGTTLHEVDFEQYIIANLHLQEQIERGNADLAELKQRTGQANLTLTLTKTDLKILLDVVGNIQQAIEKCQMDQVRFRQETEEAQKQLVEAEAENESVKNLISTSRVPEPLEYLRVKARLSDLQKMRKVLTRKENLQNITTKTTIRMMRKITGCKTLKKEWFDKYAMYNDEVDQEDMMFGADGKRDTCEPSSSSTDFREFDIFQVIQCSPATDEEEHPPSKQLFTDNMLRNRKFPANHRKDNLN